MESKKDKSKEKIVEGGFASKPLGNSLDVDVLLILFLKLLNRKLFLRSTAHLEQVMALVSRTKWLGQGFVKLICFSPTLPKSELEDGALQQPVSSNKETSLHLLLVGESIVGIRVFMSTELCNAVHWLEGILGRPGLLAVQIAAQKRWMKQLYGKRIWPTREPE